MRIILNLLIPFILLFFGIIYPYIALGIFLSIYGLLIFQWGRDEVEF